VSDGCPFPLKRAIQSFILFLWRTARLLSRVFRQRAISKFNIGVLRALVFVIALVLNGWLGLWSFITSLILASLSITPRSLPFPDYTTQSGWELLYGLRWKIAQISIPEISDQYTIYWMDGWFGETIMKASRIIASVFVPVTKNALIVGALVITILLFQYILKD